ncbi:MAG TPA: PilZ domain-containing protein [Thermodesulfovibrionales bacterium]|jgi:hypothetical protein|nr:PilZ domain-containing protein [Thermodesulfovibrionales bacterium]
MKVSPGDTVFFRFMAETGRYRGTIISADEESLIVKPDETHLACTKGQYIVVSWEHLDHYTEVVSAEAGRIELKKMWVEKRDYFRVDDVFPVTSRIIDEHLTPVKSGIFSCYGKEQHDVSIPDETISPKLWNILVDIDAKLNMILETLTMEKTGLTEAENKAVNVSASGIRLTLHEKVEIGDMREIRMLLPTTPPICVNTVGRVVWVKETDGGAYEVGLHFIDMDDTVRDEIIRYTLKRQREMLRKQKQQRG